MALHSVNGVALVFPTRVQSFFAARYRGPMENARQSSKSDADGAAGELIGMLEDPSLSRQWVARRLQRALTVERWGAPARAGLARRTGRPILAAHAAAAERRATQLQALIREIGAVPYASRGIGAPLARAGAVLLGGLNRRLAAGMARRIAEHTLAEYRALAAFVEDAPGVPAELSARIAPLQQQALAELRELEGAGTRATGVW